MKIGIDIDDTIANSYDNFCTYALKYDKKLRNTGIVKNNRKYYDDFDWSNEETSKFFEDYFLEIFSYIKPKKEAINILNCLYQDGHELIFITSRNNMNTKYNIYNITKKWMEECNIPYTKIITEAKYKGPICKKENIDLFIDDSWGQCTFIADNNKIPVILYDEYDKYKDSQGIIRVHNWNEIYTYIKS